jgi:hypothetical protein
MAANSDREPASVELAFGITGKAFELFVVKDL